MPGYVYDADRGLQRGRLPQGAGRLPHRAGLLRQPRARESLSLGLRTALEPARQREIVATCGSRTGQADLVDQRRQGFVQYYVSTTTSPRTFRSRSPPTAAHAAGGRLRHALLQRDGHNVPDIFADVLGRQRRSDALRLPATEAFEEVSETDGGRYITQYFERARFEWHPDYAGTEDEVQLGLLGAELAVGRSQRKPFRRIKSFHSDDDHTYFTRTGHSLAYAFKDYWEANGGLAVLRLPRSRKSSTKRQRPTAWRTRCSTSSATLRIPPRKRRHRRRGAARPPGPRGADRARLAYPPTRCIGWRRTCAIPAQRRRHIARHP